MKLGINGLGRIGKLSLWHHVSRKHFSKLIVNIGRDVGSGLEDLAAAIERDSTYGSLGSYLYGHTGGRVIEELDDAAGTFVAAGVPIRIQTEQKSKRNRLARKRDNAGGGLNWCIYGSDCRCR